MDVAGQDGGVDFALNPTNGTTTGVTQAQDIVVLDLMGREVFRSAAMPDSRLCARHSGRLLLGTSERTRKLVVRH